MSPNSARFRDHLAVPRAGVGGTLLTLVLVVSIGASWMSSPVLAQTPEPRLVATDGPLCQ